MKDGQVFISQAVKEEQSMMGMTCAKGPLFGGGGRAVQTESIVQDQKVVWPVLSMVGVGCGEGMT